MTEQSKKTSEAQKKWRIEHREEYNNRCREWRNKNPIKWREIMMNWRRNHREEYNACCARWRRNNPDRWRETLRASQLRNNVKLKLRIEELLNEETVEKK